MKFLKEKFRQIYNFTIKNKYLIAFSIFLLTVMFLDNNNVIKLIRNHNLLVKLKSHEIYLQNKIEHDSMLIQDINTNPEILEAFARKNFGFHKTNEDVFVIRKKY